jgi:tetratricopeptide (TPR) repeat protein
MRILILAAAVMGITSIIHAQRDSSSFFLQKGLQQKAKARRLESMRSFEKAYSFNNNNKEVVSELAAAYLDLRRYAQAREKFLQLEKMGDQSDSTYRQLTLLSFNLRQFDDAINYAQILKKKNPSEKLAWYIGKSYYEKENLGDAIKYLEIAAKEEPDNAEIHYTIARGYADMQNYKAAIPYFQKAIQLKPEQNRWIYEMALIYYAIPDDQNALKYFLQAGEKGYKKDNEYLQNLGIAYLNTGKFNEGLEILYQVLHNRPSDVNILSLVAQGNYDAKKYEEAIKYWDQILQLDKTNAEALYMIGMSFQNKGEKQKGMALCDKAIQMDPSLKSLKQQKQMPF